MGRWSDAADKAQGPSDYMKFKDGNNRIRVLTDPVVQNVTYKSDPNSPKTVFSWVVWDYDTQAPKVMTKGVSFLKSLDFIGESWGEEIPMKCDIIIKKSGEQLETKYEFSAVPLSTQLPADARAQVNKLDLNKLLPNHIPISEFIGGDKPAPADPGTEDIMDTYSRQKQDLGSATTPDVVNNDISDAPINLDDIPF